MDYGVSEIDDEPQEAQIDQALADYMSKCDSGVNPDREQFLLGYPVEIREKLSMLLKTTDWLEQMAGSALKELPRACEESSSDVHNALSSETLPLSGNQRELSQPILPCRFGDYELQRVIGRGGMGVVYYAKQIDLDRPVAIKMIRSGALATLEEVQRFYTEARAAAKLIHPNIVNVHQCGELEGHHFFSMDFVEGTDLDKLSKEKPLDCKLAARYVRDAALAIEFAHQKGIVHRDLKPANVLVDVDDRVRITDFGLAKHVGRENGLTATGAAVGTPSYMSPEQAASKTEEQGMASDVYALGAILFATLSGQPPFRGNTAVQTMLQVIHRPAPRLRTLRSDVSEDLETIADKCLQKSPSQRYRSAGDMANDLDLFLRGMHITARPISVARRAWYWLIGVPIIGAILDNRVTEPTATHRWVQRGIISTVTLMLAAWMLLLIPSSIWFRNRMPGTVRIAGGSEGGQYFFVAELLADSIAKNTGSKAESFSTGGSVDNIDRLGQGAVHLALMQADMIEHENIAVIAPLYFEAVHILTKTSEMLSSVSDLKNRRVYLGRQKAGSRSTAKRLLDYSNVGLDDFEIVEDIAGDTSFDAAILVSRIGAQEIFKLMSGKAYRLMDFGQAWQFSLREPAYHPIRIQPTDYPESDIGENGVSTVATTAYLVCSKDAPEILVNRVLECLYQPDVQQLAGVMSAEEAAHWQGIAWHPAAKAFFQSIR